MFFRRGLAALSLIGLVSGGVPGTSAFGQMEGPPAITSQPPEQMPLNGPPAASPSAANPASPYAQPPYSPYTSTPPAATPYPATAPAAASAPLVPAPPAGYPGVNDSHPIYTPYGSPDAMTASLASESQAERLLNSEEPMQWQLAPTGLMYKSYLAGEREPRMESELTHERNHGWYWQATVGGRAGLLRYGTDNSLWPQGWELDVEGAAFPRLDLEHEEDLNDCDYRGGLLSTTRLGPIETKFGYYHLSSHLGDEYLIHYPSALVTRINYVRDSLIAGIAVYANPSLRLYGEAGWCFHEDGGARPWEFQFGADFVSPEPTGIGGTPFFAINGHLRQENNFSGNLSVQTGWAWRGRDGHLARTGLQYSNGMSNDYQFYNTFEEEIGWGLWYDY